MEIEKSLNNPTSKKERKKSESKQKKSKKTKEYKTKLDDGFIKPKTSSELAVERRADRYNRRNQLRKQKINEYLFKRRGLIDSDVIKAFIRGVILRKKIKNELELIHNSKQKIIPYILSFKTRLILKSRTLQNILMDIANIKFLLQDENEQNQSIQDKQSIKDLKLKLRKKYNEFYLIYYQFKMTYEWVDEERTPNPWLQKYQQILNGEDVSFMKKETNDNINKPIKEKSQRKNKKQNYKNKDNNSSNIPEFESENNLDSNYNEEYENNEMNLNNDNYNNNLNNQKIIYKEDERPIKPMKNNNFMNSQNPFGLAENGFPEDHSYNINNNNIKKKSQRTKIKRNKMKKRKKKMNMKEIMKRKRIKIIKRK